jgi:hypothetical protein
VAGFQEIIMFSRKFFAWVGVGVLSAATIPTLAAPELARLAARHHPTRMATPHKVAHKTATKASTKKLAATPSKKPATTSAKKHTATPVKHTATALTAVTKKPTSTRAVKLHATRHVAAKTLTHKPAVAHKPVVAHKPETLTRKPVAHKTVALTHKPTAASTAKKLLH